MAISSIKLSDDSDLFINTTEYIGVCRIGILNAKCVPKDFDDTYVVRGIAKLWATKEFSSNSAILETKSAQLKGQQNRKYFHLLLHSWFQMCNRSLEAGLRPIFKREIEISNTIRGKPDFFRTESINKGLLGSVISVVSRLGLDLPELMVIRDAYEYALQQDKLLPEDTTLKAAMIQTLSRGLSILNGVPRSENIRKNATLVLNRSHSANRSESGHSLARLPPKLRHLSYTSSFCARLLLNRSDGVINSYAGQHGLLLNMNFLLQKFLQIVCRAKCTSRDNIFADGINSVTNGISMNPDITGCLPNGTHFILDAKHKIFISDDFPEARRTKGNRKGQQAVNYSLVNREDFYQIVSYSRTHHKVHNGIFYGLIGLWNPSQPLERCYINTDIEPSVIEFVENNKPVQVVISRVALNFCRILHEVGIGEKIPQIYECVFSELFDKLEQDSRFGTITRLEEKAV